MSLRNHRHDERSREEPRRRDAARAKRGAALETGPSAASGPDRAPLGRDVLVVPMTRAHIDALMHYEQELFGAEAWSAEGYRDELADTRHRHYLAAVDQDGALLGWAGVRIVADSAEILTVGVVPTARRHGIGARLLAMLLDEARHRGAVEAFLEVRVDNTGAQKLYERARFVRVGIRRGYYDDGRMDAVVMRRAL